MATYTLDPITGTYVLSADQSFVVSTDQSDYSPGSTVQITATFEPGSTLQLMVGHDIGAGADGIWGTADDVLSYDLLGTGLPWTVTADANGVINTSWFVNPDALGQSFELIATELGPDGTSTGPMATTFFTDSPVPVDLTTTTGTVNNAVFINTTQDPTGTGLIKSFLGIQDSPTESGYNTDGLPTPLDDKNVSSVHTGSVQLFQFTLVNVDGTPYDGLHGPAYREILLDIGQSGNNDSPSTHISLDALQIYIAGLGSLLDTTNQLPATTNGLTAAGATLVYNLDSAGDVSVTLSDHSSGNGALDYRILIPDSLFTDKGATDTSYVYLYADFSNANGSFEEFATGKGSTTPPPGHTGAIDGFKFQDLDGTLTTTEYSTNVLQGWTIVLEDSAHNQIATATTDANGFYTFNNLLDGTYYVHEVQQTGWTELTDASFLQTFQLNVLNGGSLEADFVNFNLIDLSGKKYLDKTGDGITSDDGGLGGIRIFVDLNDNGAFDAATETAVSTLTNSLAGHVGEWSLTGLSSSVIGHNVLEVLPTGYLETVGTAGYPISGDQSGLDFANFNLIDLSGKKYLDKTGDGITSDDSGLGGIRIFVDLNDNGAFDAATETAVSTLTSSLAGHVGEWSLTGLGPSVIGHNVLEVLPIGYLETVGTAGYPVTGDQTGLDFANFNLIDLSGKKYLDKTGDGITGDDSGLGGVRIFVDLNDNGVFDAATETAVSTLTNSLAGHVGEWSLTGLGPSVIGHEVLEVLPSGYVQTAGNAGYAITVDPTTGIADKAGLDFANFLFQPAYTLTQGYWGSHLEAWDGKDGLGKTTSSIDVAAEANFGPNKTTTLLLGDINHNGISDAGEHTLAIDLKLAQAIESGATGGDARVIMLSQAIATQLNIYNDWNKYGVDNIEPHNLIFEAVDWLKATGGVLGDGVLSSSDGSVVKNKITLGAGNQTWGPDQVFNPAEGGSVTGINGEDIKNALMWFNQGQLVVSQDGNGVAWNDGGTLENFHQNLNDNFWLTLHSQGLV